MGFRIFYAFSLYLLLLGCQNKDTTHQKKSNPVTLEELNWTIKKIKDHYVEDVEDSRMMEGAIQGILGALDDFSQYLDPESLKSILEKTKGEYGGIGVEIVFKEGYLKVISPLDHSPAYYAGIEPGDLITHIDSKPIKDLEPIEVVRKIQGKPGTKINLTLIKHQEGKAVVLTLERAVITVLPVKYKLFQNVGYVRISVFNEQLQGELKKALLDLQNKGAKGIILDLRNNPGGTLEQAIAACETFKDKGLIVRIKSRDATVTKDIQAKGLDLLAGKPIVAIVNQGSASASEILAGFLQDHKRALIIGHQTFGKGSVQQVMEIPGNKGAIKLTIAHFYTPHNHKIHKKGIKPDIDLGEGPPTDSKKEPLLINVDTIEKDLSFKRSYDLIKGLITYNSSKNS